MLDTATITAINVAARRFGLDPALIRAVVEAEGNIIKAVQCSFPAVTTLDKALDITCRSAVRAMHDYVKAQNYHDGFIDFWGGRWAPIGVKNDPTNLNKNWPKNVRAIYRKHKGIT